MARPRNENRDKVADVAFNIRITPTEKRALELLREQQVEVLRQQGVLANVSTAAVTRMLIQEAARAKLGGWPPPGDPEPKLPGMTPTEPEVPTPDPTPPAPDPVPEAAPQPVAELELDAADVRKRLGKAIKRGTWPNQSAFGKALAPRIDGMKESSVVAWVGRFLLGVDAPQERLAVVDALLREAGQ